MNTIGERIVYIREIRNLNQQDVAKAIGVTKATMSKYEHNINIPKADILCRIAEVLETSTDFLVGRTELTKPSFGSGCKYSSKKLFDMISKLSEENKKRIFERVLILLEEQRNQ